MNIVGSRGCCADRVHFNGHGALSGSSVSYSTIASSSVLSSLRYVVSFPGEAFKQKLANLVEFVDVPNCSGGNLLRRDYQPALDLGAGAKASTLQPATHNIGPCKAQD